MAENSRGIRHIAGNTYEIDYQVNGHRKQHRIQAESLSKAKAIREEHKVDFRKQLGVSNTGQERLSANFYDTWQKLENDIKSDNVSHKTFLRYKKVYWRMFEEFREQYFPKLKSIGEIDTPFFKEYKSYYVNTLGRERGGRTELIYVRALVKRLCNLGYCAREIREELKDVKKPYFKKKDYPDISKSKIKEMMDFIKTDRMDYYYPINFMCRTGRRINEVTLIERKDVAWAGIIPARINIRPETTKTKRNTPLAKLDSDLERLIIEANKASSNIGSNYLFSNKHGRKCTPDKIREYLKRVSREIIGITITPHYFRHRFLTECDKAGVSISDRMAIAGIRDIKVIMEHYSHSTDEGLMKVLEVTKI